MLSQYCCLKFLLHCIPKGGHIVRPRFHCLGCAAFARDSCNAVDSNRNDSSVADAMDAQLSLILTATADIAGLGKIGFDAGGERWVRR